MARCWPCRGVLLIMSQCSDACPSCLVSRYNLLYRDPAPKWAVAYSSSMHTFFFPLCSTYWKTNFLFFFHIISRTSELIYLFIYFSVLHTVKPQKKIKNFPQHFFSSYVLFTKHISTQHIQHTIQSHITIHQNAQRMHDLTHFPSSPR